MRRAYKFLMRPTSKQAAAMREMLFDHRLLYNSALEERREAWLKRRVSIRFKTQSAQLPEIRATIPAQRRWGSGSQQATLRRLDRAFIGFFRRCKKGVKPGFPRFKGEGQFDAVVWPSAGDACLWDSVGGKTTRVYLQGVGHVRVHAHRRVDGRIKTIGIKREGKRWYVVLSCDEVPALGLPETGCSVGVDMGIASFLTTSNGEQISNPRHGRRNADRLADAQRAMERCKRGSNRRKTVHTRVAGLYGKARRQRLDHAHKTALWLVRNHDVVAHEALRIASMTRRPAPKLDPGQPGAYLPNGAAAKAGLNRSIQDAGWGLFLSILAAKAESAGRIVIAVDPRNTSRTCPDCRHCAAENRVTQADFLCMACGFAGHADVVGATNILRAGLALHAARAA